MPLLNGGADGTEGGAVAVGQAEERQVPAGIERFVKQLVVAMKAVVLYPAASAIPRENATEAATLLGKVLRDLPEVRFAVHKDGLTYEGMIVFPGQQAFESFAREMYNRNIAEVRFHSGAGSEDILAFLSILAVLPAQLAEAGGAESRLWELGVDAVSLKEASARIVDTVIPGDGEEGEEDLPLETDRFRELLDQGPSARPRDQRMLVRLIGDKDAVRGYLIETLTGRGQDPGEALKNFKLGELTQAVQLAEKQRRALLFRSIAQAIEGLPADVRRQLITDRLLPEARSDESLASVLRQMDIDDVCRMLVEGLTEDAMSIDGLSRAIRNLALMSLAEREDVVNAAGAAMRGAGLTEATIGSVLEEVSPSVLRVKERELAAQDQPVDSILKLVNLAPGAVTHRFDDDSDYVALQEESRLGLTDGDVIGALVTLVSINSSGESFPSIMSLIEDGLGLVIERGDYGVAADAAEAIVAALAVEGLEPARRDRMAEALASLSDPAQLAEVVRAMRVYREGTTEYTACQRLLTALGEGMIAPMLEILADEPDMTVRKSMVDLLSGMAGEHIALLSVRVGDPRWYFVRNVVAILGSTHKSAILPALERTLRHPDARVRRETIRALTGIQDRLAAEMLVAALEDPDAQNVQLAARYLGTGKVRGAVASLEQVARGEGRGNRDIGPRTEAIEALGRIGDTRSIPLLESLAGKRLILGRSSVRELKASAEQALRTLSQVKEGGAS